MATVQHNVVGNSSMSRVQLLEKVKKEHMHYFLTEDDITKAEKLHPLRDLMKQYLSVTLHANKFTIQLFADIFKANVEARSDFSADETRRAFESLEKYASNLYNHPWRKEYKTIKLYCGFYKHNVVRNLVGAERILYLMGYYPREKTSLVLKEPLDVDALIEVSRNCLLGACECEVIEEIFTNVRNRAFQCSYSDIFKIRKSFICSIDNIVMFLADSKLDSKSSNTNTVYNNNNNNNNSRKYSSSSAPKWNEPDVLVDTLVDLGGNNSESVRGYNPQSTSSSSLEHQIFLHQLAHSSGNEASYQSARQQLQSNSGKQQQHQNGYSHSNSSRSSLERKSSVRDSGIRDSGVRGGSEHQDVRMNSIRRRGTMDGTSTEHQPLRQATHDEHIRASTLSVLQNPEKTSPDPVSTRAETWDYVDRTLEKTRVTQPVEDNNRVSTKTPANNNNYSEKPKAFQVTREDPTAFQRYGAGSDLIHFNPSLPQGMNMPTQYQQPFPQSHPYMPQYPLLSSYALVAPYATDVPLYTQPQPISPFADMMQTAQLNNRQGEDKTRRGSVYDNMTSSQTLAMLQQQHLQQLQQQQLQQQQLQQYRQMYFPPSVGGFDPSTPGLGGPHYLPPQPYMYPQQQPAPAEVQPTQLPPKNKPEEPEGMLVDIETSPQLQRRASGKKASKPASTHTSAQASGITSALASTHISTHMVGNLEPRYPSTDASAALPQSRSGSESPTKLTVINRSKSGSAAGSVGVSGSGGGGSRRGSVASAASATSSSASNWECAFCTYVNPGDIRICDICGKTKVKGKSTSEEVPVLQSGGKQCGKCTLVNDKENDECTACGETLKNSATYI